MNGNVVEPIQKDCWTYSKRWNVWYL